MANSFSLALLLAFLCGSTTGYQDDSGRDIIIAELIHRDSSMSPFYNSSKTATERLREAVTRSLNRINTSRSSLHVGEKDVVSEMIPDNVDYLMKIYPDKSGEDLLVMASIGSAFTWIDCEHKDDVISYEEISYVAEECQDLKGIKAGPQLVPSTLKDLSCRYTYSYLEKFRTRGVLSRGGFQLDSIGDPKKDSPHPFSLLFGCCTARTEINFNKGIQGMVGLGDGDFSLISQLANSKNLKIKKQFSYCLVPLGSSSPTRLVFGKSAIKGPGRPDSEIPFRTNIDFPYYYLTLKYVRVGTYLTSNHIDDTNMIIDFETTVTSLHPIIFGQVISFVKSFLRSLRPVEEDQTNPFNLCYNIDETIQDTTFPNIELHFMGDNNKHRKSSITLQYDNIFIQYNGMICMNIVPAAEGEVSVLGNMAQIGFHVEFHLNNKIVYFTPVSDCTKLGIPIRT